MQPTVWDYPVSNKFSATHSGEDRAAPEGVRITVSGTLLGYVGHTGKVVGNPGNHLHVQKAVWKMGKWVFVDPAGGGAAVQGTVSEVVYNAEVGNCVRIVTDDGIRWSYFHMRDKPLVKVGQKITKEEEVTKPTIETLRIVHALVGGWDIEKALKGDYDKQFTEAAGWKDINSFVYDQFISHGDWRAKLIDLQHGVKSTPKVEVNGTEYVPKEQ